MASATLVLQGLHSELASLDPAAVVAEAAAASAETGEMLDLLLLPASSAVLDDAEEAELSAELEALMRADDEAPQPQQLPGDAANASVASASGSLPLLSRPPPTATAAAAVT